MAGALAIVIRWPDGRVMTFNSDGSQYPELQGPFRDVRSLILAAATPATRFSTAGMEKLDKMEKVERHQGGPIQPLLTRIDRKISLSRLSQAETKALVEEYLKTSRTTGERPSSPLIPYAEEFVDYVYALTKGHPRSIVERCDYVITEGLKDHAKLITKQYAKEVFDRPHLPTA